MIKRKKVTYVLLFIFLFILGIFFLYERKTEKFSQIENNENIELAIYINDEETNTIPSKDSGYYYDREKSSCTNGAYINWDSISWSPVVQNMNEYKTRCELHFTTTYTEGILNGTDPVLEEPLIPVTIENDGTVKKANLESEWYSYANKEWANAIILDDQYDTLNQNGKVHGATKQDEYVSFDGVDDYIDLGLENYDFSDGLTLIYRGTIDTSINHNLGLIGNWDSSGGGISYSTVSGLYFNLYDETTDSYYTITPAFSIDPAKVYTVIGTYDGNTMKLYLDGQEIGNIIASIKIKPSPYKFIIGADPQANNTYRNYLSGNVQQVQIYDSCNK